MTEGDEITDVLTFNPEKRDATLGKQELVASIKIVGGRDEQSSADADEYDQRHDQHAPACFRQINAGH